MLPAFSRRLPAPGAVWLALAFGVGSACSSESASPDAGLDGDVQDVHLAGQDVAGAEGPGLESGGEASSGQACTATPAPSRFAEWPMPDPQPAATAHRTAYDPSRPGVVIDRVTGLMWQREVPAGAYTWEEAGNACACLSLAGHADWRLPTRIELVSLVDFTRGEPAIDQAAFPNTPPLWFWTSSTRADDDTFAWFIYFENGYSNHHQKDETYRMRCVRSMEPPAGAHGDRYQTGQGTVLDSRTGLTWQRATATGMYSFAEAQGYCRALSLAGGGWRLPSMKELQTLVDDSRADPAIDPIFADTPLEPFWTGSPVAVGAVDSAWRVSFLHGYTYDASVKYPYHARCVR